jgi:formylglycine-generating enzyme required for sulfatase activity
MWFRSVIDSLQSHSSRTSRRKSSRQAARSRFHSTSKHIVVFLTMLVAFAADARATVTIAWSRVGNPGNAADPATGSLYGAVGYSYNIGTYDVTNSQYAEFLNNKAASDPLALYSHFRGSDPHGGITQNGVSGSFTYAVKENMGNQPVNYVSWYDSIRFANWLNNGQGNGDTENGAYTLQGGTPVPSNANSIARQAGATVFLPSENEWYKMAYYDPRTTAQGGPPSNGHYWLYPTGSNAAPTAEAPPGGPNSANYEFGSFFLDHLTDVGAYTRTTSPYGAFDMSGNAEQWNEALIIASERGLRGGSFLSFGSPNLLSSARHGGESETSGGNLDFGFRVASVVPEPSTGVLAVIACGMTSCWRKRFK